jgi:hypothetical protein
LDLLAAGIVLFLLLLASYSQRRTWFALGSTALSIVLIAGFVFLSTSQEATRLRDGLGRLASTLPAGWDQRALALAGAIEHASTALAEARKRAAGREPIQAASVSQWVGLPPEIEAEAAPPEAAPASPDATIKWFLDELPPAASETLLLSGANVSDQSLEDVEAVLKPDSGAGELALVLDVEGRAGDDGAVIPPGARFSLAAKTLTKDEARQLGGAILSFAYVQAGRRKTSIMYLTPPMLAQAAAPD